jgi:hypothetical protein
MTLSEKFASEFILTSIAATVHSIRMKLNYMF